MSKRQPSPTTLLISLVLGSLACNGSGTTPPAASGTDGAACDTDAPPVTTGGTYGPEWQAAQDESGPNLLDIGGGSGGPGFDVPPPTAIPDADPTGWTYEPAEDSYYRSPTALELSDNDWLSPLDLFVIPPRPTLLALAAGAGNADLPIPMFDEFGGRPQTNLDFRTLILGRTGTNGSVPFIEQRWENDCLRRSTLEVAFSFYESRSFDPTAIDINSIVGSAISSPERNSLAVHGATKDLSFSLRGPFSPERVKLELLLPPSELDFYILKTEFDPAPGQLLAGSGTGSPLLQDNAVSSLTSQQRTSVPPPQSCFDGVENNDETDIDCGGDECPPCELGDSCEQASDCTSRLCWLDQGNSPGICTSQCSDGFDNDGDGFADSCDFNCVEHTDFGTDTVVHTVPLEHAKTVGLFGTMEFCTTYESAYLASFAGWSSTASLILNNIIPDVEPADYDPTLRPPPFAVVMRGCIIADNSDIAVGCDTTPAEAETPCPDALVGYPLRTISTANWSHQNDGVNARAWDLVNFTIENGYVADTAPVQMAAIANLGGGTNAMGISGNGLAVRVEQGWAEPEFAGAASFNGTTDRAGRTLAHELGHLVGLAHDDAVYPGTNVAGIMQDGGAGAYPAIEWAEDSTIFGQSQGKAWQGASSKTWPRASGFRYVGCTSPADCDNGHPGLTCSSLTESPTPLYCIPE